MLKTTLPFARNVIERARPLSLNSNVCIFVVVSLIAVTGCTTSAPVSGTSVAPVGSLDASTMVPVATAVAAPGSADYKVSPLDVLDISVFQVPDLTKAVQVNSGGQISLPLIGAVTASGKTTQALEKEIAAKLGAKYLQAPQVTVVVKEYTSQRFTVEGAVNKPGVFSMTGRTTLLQSVAMAGGLDRVADPRGIVVFRETDGVRKAAKFDLPAIRSGKESDPVLVGGDIVVVDQHGGKTALRGIRESLGIFSVFSPL